MNFLAHIFLSGDNPKIIAGNFIGDFVKGAQIEDFEEKIQIGISLHRAIDHFTDTHKIVKESKDRLRSKYRHYAPVIVDVFYDHFLARDWKQYHHLELDMFTMEFYKMISGFKDQLPEGVNHMLAYMKRDNWLLNYRSVEGIHRALSGMARRTTFDSKMEQTIVDLKANYEEFGAEFHRFFPELQGHCDQFLREHT